MADETPIDPSRREFVSTVVGGLAVAATSAFAAGLPVTEANVQVKTADGTCDAAFIHPASGSHPAVIVWPDAFGLRPAMRDIGKRLAGEGFAVLVPNPFYRVAKAPVFTDASSFNFQNPDDRAKLQPLMGSIGAVGAAEKDAEAFVAFLDAQPQVDKAKKIGTQGYCMGGPLVVRTAAAVPTRIGAGASFHGGGLVTSNPNSPHLLAPKIKGRMYIAVASNDDKTQPDAKDKLREAFAAARAGRDRGLRFAARLVRPRHAAAERRADLQQAGRREGMDQAGRAVQGCSRLAGGLGAGAIASGARVTLP